MSGYTTYWKKNLPAVFYHSRNAQGKQIGGGGYCQIHHTGCLFGVKGSLTIALKGTCRLGSKQHNSQQNSTASYCN
jgi:hypothetical protein